MVHLEAFALTVAPEASMDRFKTSFSPLIYPPYWERAATHKEKSFILYENRAMLQRVKLFRPNRMLVEFSSCKN